jgi:hypothetical protein
MSLFAICFFDKKDINVSGFEIRSSFSSQEIKIVGLTKLTEGNRINKNRCKKSQVHSHKSKTERERERKKRINMNIWEIFILFYIRMNRLSYAPI